MIGNIIIALNEPFPDFKYSCLTPRRSLLDKPLTPMSQITEKVIVKHNKVGYFHLFYLLYNIISSNLIIRNAVTRTQKKYIRRPVYSIKKQMAAAS